MYSPEQLKDWNRKAKFACFGSCLIHIILGGFYSWGNLNIYFVSYYKYKDPEAYSYLTPNVMAFFFPFMGFLMFITTPFGIKIGTSLGFSLSSFLFTIILSISIFVSSFVSDFWLFVLFYGVIPGFLMGILSSQSIYVVLKYRVGKNYINGLMMLFYGIGTAFANFLAFLSINSTNSPAFSLDDGYHYFSDEISVKVPQFLQTLSVFYFIFGIIGSNFLKVPIFDSYLDEPLNIELSKTDESEKFEYVYAQVETEKDDTKKFYIGLQEESVINSRFYNLKSVLKSWKFYQMFFLIFLSSPFGFFMANYYKMIGMKTVNDDLSFVIIGSISGLGNGFARFSTPFLINKIPFKIFFIILLCVQIAFIPTFTLIDQDQNLFGVWSAVALLCQGCIYALFPNITFKIFGRNLWVESYTFMLFSFVLANILHYALTALLLEILGLVNLLWVFFALSCGGLVLIFLFKEEEKNKEKN